MTNLAPISSVTLPNATQLILKSVLEAWPKHRKFIEESFSGRDENILKTSEKIAELILTLAGDNLSQFGNDYRWTCEKLLEEELYFRRNDRYRLNSLDDAIKEVYDNHEFMVPYLNGLLLSQLMWPNHTCIIDMYLREFLPILPEGSAHLEIGPGHGLLLYFAARQENVGQCSGWDISQTSLDQTADAIKLMGSEDDVMLEIQDATDVQSDKQFDSIVMSEILEHLEDPEQALRSVKKCLRRGGKLFVNVPVNSPAPDHIYLLRTPEESCDFLERAGYEVLSSKFSPLGGYTLEKARKNDLTISCGLIAQAKT